MQRSIYEVVIKIIDEIPIDNVDMIYNLKKLVDDMPYCPPEMTVTLWNRLSEILNCYIPFKPLDKLNELEMWENKVIKIFMGDEIHMNLGLNVKSYNEV